MALKNLAIILIKKEFILLLFCRFLGALPLQISITKIAISSGLKVLQPFPKVDFGLEVPGL